MKPCPSCGNPHCVSNKLTNVSFDDVADSALVAKRTGHLAHAFSGMAVWACVEAVNVLRGAWRCPNCDTRFN